MLDGGVVDQVRHLPAIFLAAVQWKARPLRVKPPAALQAPAREIGNRCRIVMGFNVRVIEANRARVDAVPV